MLKQTYFTSFIFTIELVSTFKSLLKKYVNDSTAIHIKGWYESSKFVGMYVLIFDLDSRTSKDKSLRFTITNNTTRDPIQRPKLYV